MKSARDGGPRPRRAVPGWLAAGGALLFTALVGFWWVTRGPAEPPRPEPAAPAPVAATEEALPQVAAPPPLPDELPEPIRRYLERTPYPPDSGRLTAIDEDLLHPNRRHERPHPIPESLGGDPQQTVTSLLTADHYYYTSDEILHAFLQVMYQGSPMPVGVRDARIVREGRGGDQGKPVPVLFVWERDRYTLELPLAAFADHHGPLRLTTRFEWEPGAVHEESLRIFVTPAERIPARLTGEVRAAVVDGSVRVEAGLEVLRPGFFRFDANLYGAGEQPVGYALFKGELAAGPSEVPLVFYGKVLRDAGVTGPFTLGELRGYRFLEGAYPDRERLPDDPQRHPLGDLPLASLTDAAHVSAHELRMVELMMEDLARGISLEAPPPPGPDPAAAPADPGAPTARRPAASPR